MRPTQPKTDLGSTARLSTRCRTLRRAPRRRPGPRRKRMRQSADASDICVPAGRCHRGRRAVAAHPTAAPSGKIVVDVTDRPGARPTWWTTSMTVRSTLPRVRRHRSPSAAPHGGSGRRDRAGDRAAADCGDQLGVQCDDEGPPAVVFVDPDQLHRALANLLENAAAATPPGGRIVVTQSLVDGQLLIRVMDPGSGVPDSERERIFDRFVRLSSSRTVWVRVLACPSPAPSPERAAAIYVAFDGWAGPVSSCPCRATRQVELSRALCPFSAVRLHTVRARRRVRSQVSDRAWPPPDPARVAPDARPRG